MMSIRKILEEYPGYVKGLEVLVNKKPINQVYAKACEELSELLMELLKKINKPEKVKLADIFGEMADVQANLMLLEMIHNDKDSLSLKASITIEKAEKFLNSKDLKKYKS